MPTSDVLEYRVDPDFDEFDKVELPTTRQRANDWNNAGIGTDCPVDRAIAQNGDTVFVCQENGSL